MDVTVSWEGHIIDVNISELLDYESHGWSIYDGQAYAPKMYNYSDSLDSIVNASGNTTNIYNYGNIDAVINYGDIGNINTGEGSNIGVVNFGIIGGISTGAGSHTDIYNYGIIDSVTTGDSTDDSESTTNIKNNYYIGFINTGKESENEIKNNAIILSLITGLNNSTEANMDGDGAIVHTGGQGKLYINGALQGTGGTEPTTMQKIGGYLKASGKQVVLGNYTDDVTLLGTAGQVGAGVIGVDLPGDIRDITYDVTNWEWSWSHAGQTTIDVIGVLPLVGAVKYIDEAGALLKNSDEAAAALKGVSEAKVPNINTKVINAPEVKAPNAIKSSQVTQRWDDYLGQNTTNINPRTRQVDPNRIFSADGTKSVRFDSHEMNSMGTSKFHYHEETWTYDAVNDVMTINNTLQRIK